MHGEGTKTWTNGNKSVGAWKDGKRHGRGTFTWANGSKYVDMDAATQAEIENYLMSGGIAWGDGFVTMDKATGGLFGCMGDPAGFACSLFIPCCAVGQTEVNKRGGGNAGTCNSTCPNTCNRRNEAACIYLCCCPYLGCVHSCDVVENGKRSESWVLHLGKYFCCHPCYVAQGLRASKIALDFNWQANYYFTFTGTNIAGAPDCNDMER